MCIAVPMEIVSIDEEHHSGRVCHAGNELPVDLSLVSPNVGDYVLVHAGCAIEIVERASAQEILDIFASLKDFDL